MLYRVVKRVKKNFDEVYTREKQTSEICIDFGDVKIEIIESDLGRKVTPYVFIRTKSCTYSADLDTFVKRCIGVW